MKRYRLIRLLVLALILLPILVFSLVVAQQGGGQPVTMPLEVLRYDETLPDECQMQVYATHTMPIQSTFFIDLEYRLDNEVVFTHTVVNPFYICVDEECPNAYMNSTTYNPAIVGAGVIVYTPTIVGGGIYDEWRRGRWVITSENELWIRVGLDDYDNEVFTKTGQTSIERILCGYGQGDTEGFYLVGDFVVGKLYLPIILNNAD